MKKPSPSIATTGPITQPAAPPRLREPRVFNRRSRVRFGHDRTLALAAHLGREPSYPERIIIARIVAIEWELRRLDAKIDAGEELSGHALRARLAAENRLRLDLQALGMKAAPAAAPTLGDYLAARAAQAGASGAAMAEGDAEDGGDDEAAGGPEIGSGEDAE